jgi:hypothetical protein
VFRSEATRKHDAIVGGTAQERTPWLAVQRAAWAAVRGMMPNQSESEYRGWKIKISEVDNRPSP